MLLFGLEITWRTRYLLREVKVEQEDELVRGRRCNVKVGHDVVVGVAELQARADLVAHHRPEAVVEPVGPADLELVVEQRVERGVDRHRSPEGRLHHREGLELGVGREVENVPTGKEVVRGLRAELAPVVVQVRALEHVGHREGHVVLLGVVEEPRADVQERVVRVLREGVVARIGDVAVADLREQPHLVEGRPGLHPEGQAVLPAQVERVGDVGVGVGLLHRADLVGDHREAHAHVLAHGHRAREGERRRGVLDVDPLLAVQEAEGEVLLRARIGRVDHVHVVHVLRVVWVLLGLGIQECQEECRPCQIYFLHVSVFCALRAARGIRAAGIGLSFYFTLLM